MILLAGLGNPGKKYEKTRHNIGFRVIEQFAEQADDFSNFSEKYKSRFAEGLFKGEKIILLQPQTFMNNSGQAVKEAANYFSIEPADIWVIHDELDLPFGYVRISFGSGAAGHNGIKSIIDLLNTKDFKRFRVGINSEQLKQIPADEFVLRNFSKDEENQLPQIIEKVISEIETEINTK